MKLQENQTGDASQFLGSYILSYYMYMFVLNLLILTNKGISEREGHDATVWQWQNKREA